MTQPSTTMREAGTSILAARAPRWRPTLSHALIGLAVLMAFAFNLLALRDRTATTMVAVADQPIPAGTPVSMSDLRFVPIPSDFEGLASLLEQSAAAGVEGWIADRNIGSGSVIERSAVVEPGAPSGFRSMSIPVSVDHATGGTLRSGDRIDVIVVDDGVAEFIASDIGVLSTAEAAGGLGAIGDYHVVVAVDAEQALDIASAIAGGSIELVRATGAPPIVTDDDGP